MTAEQKKAKELIEKFGTKEHAILCVDEIINASPTNPLKDSYIELYSDMIDEAIAFYQTVKQEIINYK
jgi:hypothetical protein